MTLPSITGNVAQFSGIAVSPTFTFDAVPAEDEIIVAVVVGTGAAAPTITEPSGWTNVISSGFAISAASTVFVVVLWHRVTGAEESGSVDTWTLTSLFNASRTTTVDAYRIIDASTESNPIKGSGSGQASFGAHQLAAVTPTVDGGLIFSTEATSGTISTAPTGWTRLQGAVNPSANFTKDAESEDSVTVGPVNLSSSTGPWVTISFVLAAAGPTAAGTPTDTRDTASGAGDSDTTRSGSGTPTDTRDIAAGVADTDTPRWGAGDPVDTADIAEGEARSRTPGLPFSDYASLVELGCASEYVVIVTARDLTTYATELPWSSLQWSRTLDDISTASVTVPDSFGGLDCVIALGSAIVPWRYGIRIERNGSLVWAGPITNISRGARSGSTDDFITISAQDAMAWTTRRVPSEDLSFTDEDAGVVFKAMLDDAVALDNVFGLECPDFVTGYTMTREVLAADFEYIYDILQDLANSAVDFYMLGTQLVVRDRTPFFEQWLMMELGNAVRPYPTTDTAGQYLAGLFVDESYAVRPGYTLDGSVQANNVIVPGTDSGEAGFRRFWTASDVDPLDGVLTYVDVNSLYRPQPGTPLSAVGVFQERADTLLELRRTTPVIISGGVLSQKAPVEMEGLLPGSIWSLDLGDHGLSHLLTVQRLQRVDVHVAVTKGGIVEQVSPTLIPLGSDGSGG